VHACGYLDFFSHKKSGRFSDPVLGATFLWCMGHSHAAISPNESENRDHCATQDGTFTPSLPPVEVKYMQIHGMSSL
jgi:hypothetical protein